MVVVVVVVVSISKCRLPVEPGTQHVTIDNLPARLADLHTALILL